VLDPFAFFHSPLGWLHLRGEGEALLSLDYDGLARPPEIPRSSAPGQNLLLAVAWLEAYFSTDRLPGLPALKPAGTVFQQRVWSEVAHVPWGECITYAELAQRLGSAPRAVGGALRANPIPILIPCHRVVAASGLGGYAGASELGQARKRWLLRHEGVSIA